MSEEFRNIFKSMNRASLTDSERAGMRNTILSYMQERPLRAPLSIRVQDALSAYAGYFETSFTAMRIAPFAFALVMVVGVSTSYAAENAVPGDVLYPIKLNINEAVRGSLAVSEPAKAQWNTELMTRRLDEAQKLAADGRLTPVVQSEIQERILRTADKFDESVRALAQTEDGVMAAATAQSNLANLEASLTAHEDVLAALSGDDASSGESIEAVTVQMIAQPMQAMSASFSAERAKSDEVRGARMLIESHISAARENRGKSKGETLDKEQKNDGEYVRVDSESNTARTVGVPTLMSATMSEESDERATSTEDSR